MTDPAGTRGNADRADRDARHEMSVAESERRMKDPTKRNYGAHDDPDQAVRDADDSSNAGATSITLDSGPEMPNTVEKQPPPPGVGPFPIHLIALVIALVVFVALLVALG
jgi:hypothetical protein